MDYISDNKVVIVYNLPMSEMVIDFYDKLKTISRGYASMEYEVTDYQTADLVKLDILINGDAVDALSVITHRSQADYKGRSLV